MSFWMAALYVSTSLAACFIVAISVIARSTASLYDCKLAYIYWFLATCSFYSQNPTEYEGRVLKRDHHHNIQNYIAISYASTTSRLLLFHLLSILPNNLHRVSHLPLHHLLDLRIPHRDITLIRPRRNHKPRTIPLFRRFV